MARRVAVLLAVLACAVLAAGAASAPQQTWVDSFDYPNQSGGEPNWRTDSVGWAVREGVLRFSPTAREFAALEALPEGRRVSVEATLSLAKRLSDGWAIAGVAVQRDGANFWHFAFVEAPADQGHAHYVELSESLDGQWRANFEGPSKLAQTADEGQGFQWAYGRPYRLRLALTPGGIEGTVSAPDGAVLRRLAHRFEADVPAVCEGRPALDAALFAGTFDDVRAEVGEPVPEPTPAAAPPYDAPGCNDVRGQATGFFHTENLGGTWWLVDPNGRGFYAVATQHANYNAHWCQTLGYARYHRNVEAKYGGEQAWADAVADRLARWGFNALGWGCSGYLRHRGFPHVEMAAVGASFVDSGDIVRKTTWTGFPNVFSPLWPRQCDIVARRVCAPNRDDPWLIGYFLDNELQWHGEVWNDPFGLWTEAWRKPARHSAKQAWMRVVRARCGTVEEANRALDTSFQSFDELAASQEPKPLRTDAARAMATEYVRQVADLYFREATAAIRRHDPNHLILGTRFPDWSPGVWDVCGRYCDVVSLNSYPRLDVDRGVPEDLVERYRSIYEQAGKPLMVTEWSFPSVDSGLPCTIGAGMRVGTQEQRARCFRAFQSTLFALPFVVGSDYFMYVDEPALGISDTFPENTNYGLVRESDEPYAELTAAAAALNPQVYAIRRAGRLDSVYRPEPVAWTRPLPPRAAETFVTGLTTGPLKLSRDAGGPAWRMELGGTPLGAYVPLIHQNDGQDHWTMASYARVTAVYEDEAMTVVDAEFTYAPPAAGGPPAYAAGWRFWVPSPPYGGSSGWFGAQSLWVKNTDARPWRLVGIFHYTQPAIGGSPEGDGPSAAGVPNFYLPLASWEDAAAGLGLGVLALGDGLSVSYWKDGTGFHSDCRQPLDVWLGPGESYEAAGPLAVHFGYRAGGLKALLAAAEAVRREVEALR